ncbi:IS3 family transposase [Nitriliruptor alkaliphilus]|uniref:IS3 family transposase n=1 Tax=Nitriliruptor alkaliphilus TaxID=427918 RepID=UPI001FDF4F83|nr:IS3 family transposase [Nitriliruptor alkaliphilus]
MSTIGPSGTPNSRRYSPEEKAQAVRMVQALRTELGATQGTVARVAKQLGYGVESVRQWVKQAEIDGGERPGTTSSDAERLRQLEQENRELKRANAILRSASGFLRGGARPPTEVMVAYIDAHKDEFGVEPICQQLPIAPSTYYAAKSREPSARMLRDAVLMPLLLTLWTANYEVYGIRKMWKALQRAGEAVGRDQVARLMRELGIQGARRGKRIRTTRPDASAARHPDLVDRQFIAERPNLLWVTDLTVVPTWGGAVYVCFITDAFSRMIVGWRVATHMRTDMVLDALEMARWKRNSQLEGLVCHSDAGSQFTSIRYGERLAELGAVPSIGSVGDSYDNALAEAVNSLYKTELIRRKGPWRNVDDVELATLGWVHWFNHERLHSTLGDIPPVEFETATYSQRAETSHPVGIQ